MLQAKAGVAWHSQEEVLNSEHHPPWGERTERVSGVSAFWTVAQGTGICLALLGVLK